MRILHFGTFDVENYGDMLFPLLAHKKLNQKIGTEIVSVAPVGSHRFWSDTIPSVSIKEIPAELEFNGFLIGGGNIIHTQRTKNSSYIKQQMFAYPDLWLGIGDLAQKGCPICWNAPGVPHSFELEEYDLIANFLQKSSYISVRDRLSFNNIRNICHDGDVKIVPDTAWGVDELWDQEDLRNSRNEIFRRYGIRQVPERIFLVHLNKRYLGGMSDVEIGNIIDTFSLKYDAFPLFVPLAPTHGDIELAQRVGQYLGQDSLVFKDPQSVKEIVAIFESAFFYAGSSMHGFITASAFGVPGVCITNGDKNKFSGLQELFFPLKIHYPAWGNLSELGFDDLKRISDMASLVHKDALCTLEEHWSAVFFHFFNVEKKYNVNKNDMPYRLTLLQKKLELAEKQIIELSRKNLSITADIAQVRAIRDERAWKILKKIIGFFKRIPSLSFVIKLFLQFYLSFNDKKILIEISEDTIKDYIRNKKTKNRIVVYTCIAGDYDELLLPSVLSSDIDYVCFADSSVKGYGIWDVREIPYYHPDKTKMARFVKTHPHILLGDYEIAIWVDANVLIKTDFSNYIQKLVDSGADGGFISHPLRTCTYDEGVACIEREKDTPDIINSQLARYKRFGLSRKTGLYETGFFVVRLGSKSIAAFFSCWWSEIYNFSKRDQLSVVYAKQTSCLVVTSLFEPGQCLRSNVDFFLIPHDKKTSVFYPPFVYSNYVNYVKKKSCDLLSNGGKYSLEMDIVICVHNALQDVVLCLESVERSLTGEQRIIIINDCSDNSTSSYLESYSRSRSNVTLIVNEVNLGYTKSANIGLKHSTSPLVVLLNSDTIVPKYCLRKIARVVYSGSTIGIVGPLSNAAGYQSIPSTKKTKNNTAINDIPASFSVDDIDRYCEDWSSCENRAFVPLVHGFCMAIRREVLYSIGYFDDENFDRYYGEENDFCFRASRAGFDLVVATDIFVYHKKSRSISDEQRLLFMAKAGKRLRDIYGKHNVEVACYQVDFHPLLKNIRVECKKLYESVSDN